MNGTDLILRHCAVLNLLDDARPSAAVRLQQALGDELAQLLVFALAPQGRRGSSSP
jgi:hypothetical protein